VAHASTRPVPSSRGRLFAAVCIVFGIGAAGGLFGVAVVLEWFVTGAERVHRVHNIGVGAISGVILTTAFLVQLRRPQRRVAPLQQVVAAGVAAFVAAGLAWDVDYVVIGLALVAAGGIAIALHPSRRRFLRVHRGVSIPLAVMVVAGAVPLVGYALGQASLQRNGAPSDPHVQMSHYAGMAFMAIALVLCGAVAALRGRGYRIAAWTTGLGAAVFGAAGFAFPHVRDAASTPGRRWGLVAVAGGLLFAAVAEWDRRRLSERRSWESSSAS
jgi:hypothetical protein